MASLAFYGIGYMPYINNVSFGGCRNLTSLRGEVLSKACRSGGCAYALPSALLVVRRWLVFMLPRLEARR